MKIKSVCSVEWQLSHRDTYKWFREENWLCIINQSQVEDIFFWVWCWWKLWDQYKEGGVKFKKSSGVIQINTVKIVKREKYLDF